MQKISENLMVLGVHRTVSLVVEALVDGEPHTLREIERITDLRQPEVSLAMKEIANYTKVYDDPNGSNGRGRPIKIVELPLKSYRRYVLSIVERTRAEQVKVESAAKELLGE
jgi:predicted transcriptional regulator